MAVRNLLGHITQKGELEERPVARPVFFSFASAQGEIATAIADRFSGDVIYCYTRSGEDGADFWDEIERQELSGARGFVIFLSAEFLNADACQRELKLASELLKSGSIKQAAILRLDDTPLILPEDGSDEKNRVVYQHLAGFTDRFRASGSPFDADKAFQTVDRLIRSVTAVAMPIFPRPQIVETLRVGAKAGEFQYRPAVWVSGFNGYGRRTMIREFYRTLNGDAVAVEFDISELSLPLPLLLMIEERALGADAKRLEQLQEELGQEPIEVVAVRLADAIKAVASQSRFIILRQVRVYEERAQPPEWIAKVIVQLDSGTAPVLFLTVQVPPLDELVIACRNKLGTMRLAALGILEAENFVRATIIALGNSNLAWTPEIIGRIIKGSNGTPELITKIVKLSSTLPSLENLDAVIGSETQEFLVTMTRLTSWAFAQLKHDDERRALLILGDLTLASANDIAAFLGTDRPMADILGALERVGLVERDDGDLYRLSPLLSHRLSANLVTPELTRWLNDAVLRFVASPIQIDAAGLGMVSVQARISAAMLAGAEVPEVARKFVSAANYLQSGIRAYRANRMDIAHKLLREAFARREAFSDTARREAARFYGLICARQGDETGVSEALTVLDNHYLSKPVAHFIRGFKAEFEKNFGDAIDHYEKARKADEDLKQTVREGLTIRYLVGCLLRTSSPNFERAVRLADRAAILNKSIFVLTMRARTYLHRYFKGSYSSQKVLDDWWDEYEGAAETLRNDPGPKDFYFQVRAEEAMLDPKQGPDEAIEWMSRAVEVSGRFDHRLRMWQYMARSGKTEHRIALMKGIENVANSPTAQAMSNRERYKMIDFYAQALGVSGPFRKFQLDQVFPKDADGHNLNAHRNFGKNPNPADFWGDEIQTD